MSDSSDIPRPDNRTNANRYRERLRDIPWTAFALLILGALLTFAWVGALGWVLLMWPILTLAAP
jgi:hypothetical protein